VSFSSIFYILISGCLGLIIYLIGSFKKTKEKEKTPSEKEVE
jgi:hypothetical protein